MFGGSLGLIPGNTVRVHDLGAVVAVQAADMVAQHSRSGGSSIGRRGRLDSRGAALGGRSAGFTSSWSNPGLYIGPIIHIHLLEARGAVPGALRGHGYACQILVPIGRRPVGGGGPSNRDSRSPLQYVLWLLLRCGPSSIDSIEWIPTLT